MRRTFRLLQTVKIKAGTLMSAPRDQYKSSLYRPAVGMMIVNKKNKIFMGQRQEQPLPAWQMPQGGISPHEETDQAMLRELQEEVGTRDIEIIMKSKEWYTYDLPADLANRLWSGRFKGQRQIWYALRFRGEDEDINIHTYHPEFRLWKWVDKEEVLDLSISFKRDLYNRVLTDLWPAVEGHSVLQDS